MAPALEYAKAYALTRQGAVDEDRLAVDPRDPPAIVGEIDDLRFLNRAGPQLPAGLCERSPPPPGHAASNALRCSALESRSILRTRATSAACSAAFK